MKQMSRTSLQLEPYSVQVRRWPGQGRNILAQFDDDSVVVYQAYRASIADFAMEHQAFGGDFSFTRMSWVKPGFLWMMYRSGWATKTDQERILALWVRRSYFDAWLSSCVPSRPTTSFKDEETWRAAVKASDVRLQWDPDHDPRGEPVPRRAIQLGLRGGALASFQGQAFHKIEDVTDLAISGRDAALSGEWQELETPREEVYPVPTESASRLGVDV